MNHSEKNFGTGVRVLEHLPSTCQALGLIPFFKERKIIAEDNQKILKITGLTEGQNSKLLHVLITLNALEPISALYVPHTLKTAWINCLPLPPGWPQVYCWSLGIGIVGLKMRIGLRCPSHTILTPNALLKQVYHVFPLCVPNCLDTSTGTWSPIQMCYIRITRQAQCEY